MDMGGKLSALLSKSVPLNSYKRGDRLKGSYYALLQSLDFVLRNNAKNALFST